MAADHPARASSFPSSIAGGDAANFYDNDGSSQTSSTAAECGSPRQQQQRPPLQQGWPLHPGARSRQHDHHTADAAHHTPGPPISAGAAPLPHHHCYQYNAGTTSGPVTTTPQSRSNPSSSGSSGTHLSGASGGSSRSYSSGGSRNSSSTDELRCMGAWMQEKGAGNGGSPQRYGGGGGGGGGGGSGGSRSEVAAAAAAEESYALRRFVEQYGRADEPWSPAYFRAAEGRRRLP